MDLSLDLDEDAICRSMDEQGFCIVPDVASREAAAAIKQRLWEIAADLETSGVSTHIDIIDRNPANVRINDLPDHDPAFLEMLTRPEIGAMVERALGGTFIISNFTANIARPGALPMRIHSDMALVMPGPWHHRWSLNVIWCLDDVSEENGATRYLPDSHKISDPASLPVDAEALTEPFEASAGSIIVMDGRLWHTSGRNTTKDKDRALLFGYYTRAFIRPQVNWHESLRADVVRGLSEIQRQMFGFGPLANTHGVPLIALRSDP